jgi:hypothetical protein
MRVNRAGVATVCGISVLLGSCVPTIKQLGEPKSLPVGLSWCSEATLARFRDRPPHDWNATCHQEFCRVSAEWMTRCVPQLVKELPPRRGNVHGRFILGMTSDQDGSLTELCLISSDLGDTPRALECVVATVRDWNPRVDANLKEEPWPITWMLEE